MPSSPHRETKPTITTPESSIHIDGMDPLQHLALQNAKLRTILYNWRTSHSAANPESESDIDMPPPPAYHTVVNPTESLPEMMHRLYDAEDEDGKDGETPEININATTQIRGHGNIISIAQMDSMRVANLLAILIHGGIPPQAQTNTPRQPQGQQENIPAPSVANRPVRERRELPKINININCGATVVGDRNIVGPGLGDIARHMQLAQQRQQAQQQQQQQQQQNQANLDPRTAQPLRPVFGHSQSPLVTPPMSRSSSFGSEGSVGVKRKAEERCTETPAKKERRM